MSAVFSTTGFLGDADRRGEKARHHRGGKAGIDAGLHPIKGTIGQKVRVEADVSADGHDEVSCALLYRRCGDDSWNEGPMQFLVNDRWRADFYAIELGRSEYSVQGWGAVDYAIGAGLLEAAAARSDGEDARRLLEWARIGRAESGVAVRRALVLDEEPGRAVDRNPPLHPIGCTHRKGRNNSLHPGPGDPGSPWAIGSAGGGHKSINPGFCTLEDFQYFVAKASGLGIEYTENPPKKYQNIFPFDFETEAWPELWVELKSTLDFWIANGVRIFRVDNPHTKRIPMWEWLIGEVKREHPDTIFLAGALMGPTTMYEQSCTIQSTETPRFHDISNDQLICYSKQTEDLQNIILVVVNLDPHHTQAGSIELPVAMVDRPYQVHDLLSDARYLWSGARNYVESDPRVSPAQIFRVRRRLRTEREFEYFM